MNITPTDIPDIKLIKPVKHGDARGFFMETYRKNVFAAHGIRVPFVQDNISLSKKGTIRGLHYQIIQPQAKLVMVLKGRILDVAVDIRAASPTFGSSVAVELDGQHHQMLYIPAGFAHGFEVLSGEALFYYKCSDYYHPQGERGIAWNDPDLAIPWRSEKPIISEKDRHHPNLDAIQPDDIF